MDNSPRNIVIVGGGVMGCTTAYYLTRHPKYNPEIHTITIVEAAGIASSASGKAGGLLGLWAYPEETVPLSYRLHRELADEHDGGSRWGYRRLQGCGTIRVNLQDPHGAVYGPLPPDEDGGGSAKGRAAKKSKKRKRDTASSSARLKADTTEPPSEATSRSPTTTPHQLGQAQQGQSALQTPISPPVASVQETALAAVTPQPEPQQPESPQAKPQHPEAQHFGGQHLGPRGPEPQHPEPQIDINPEPQRRQPPLEQQVEQMLRQQEEQDVGDKPVPVAVLFGLKTGSGTRWKSIFRYSNGDVTYGPRVPPLPPRSDGGATTDPKAAFPDRTISAPCSGPGHQRLLTIHREAPKNNLEPNSNGSSVPTETANLHGTSSSNDENAPRSSGAPPRTGDEPGPGPNALDSNAIVPSTAEPNHVAENGVSHNRQDGQGVEEVVAGKLQPPAQKVTKAVDSGLNGRATETTNDAPSISDCVSVAVVVGSKEVDMAGLQNGSPDESTDAHMSAENGATESNDDDCIHVRGPSSEGSTQEPWHKVPKLDETAAASLTELPLPVELDWVKRDMVSAWEEQGYLGRNETAQVHPYHFTTSMAALAQERGVSIRLGTKVTRIITSSGASNGKTSGGGGGGVVRGVELLDRNRNHSWLIEDVTDVLVTAGPWTSTLLPQSKVRPVRAHSVVWEADVSPFAVFTSITLPDGYVPAHRAAKGERRKHNRVDPEAYARPFGEVYACGEIDELVPLPPTADMVEADESLCEDLIAYLGLVSPQLASAPVKARQACYMPERKPHPVFGQTLTPGLWVAAGHSCWGIQHAPATGLLMAEMMMDGRVSSIDPGLIAKFDPRRAKI